MADEDIEITPPAGSGEEPKPDDPQPTPSENLIQNGDFASGKEPWKDYVDNVASAKTVFADNKARYEISNVGTADWNIQLKQEGLAMEKGSKYKVNFKIASSLDRQVKLAIMGKDSEKDTWCGGTDIDLTKNKLKSFSWIATLGAEYTEGTVAFQLSLGKPEGAEILEAHAIEISDISITKVADDATADEVADEDIEITPPAGSGEEPKLEDNNVEAAPEESETVDQKSENTESTETEKSEPSASQTDEPQSESDADEEETATAQTTEEENDETNTESVENDSSANQKNS